MRALLIVSRMAGRTAGRNLEDVVDLVRGKGMFPIVETTLVGEGSPALGEAIGRCAQRGARRLVIVPYFLEEGTEVRITLAEALAAASRANPGIEVLVGDTLGRGEPLMEVVQERKQAVSFS